MSTAEILLALRSPSAGWLATLLCALDEALQDPDFDDAQREIVRAMLDRQSLPGVVASAAHQCLCEFEEAVQARQAPVQQPSLAPSQQRPNLTLCVSNG